MTKLRASILSILLVAACLGQQRQPPARLLRSPSRGTHGAVAAGSEYATEAGMRMYFSGGNAVDAGVAALLAAAVAEFSHLGLGGEAPILIRTQDGKVFAIAGVGTMPKLATADFFRKHKLTPDEMEEPPKPAGLKAWVPVAGILPALVPGMAEAALVALREFGTKSFAEAVEPAIELADGFPIDEMRSDAIAAQPASSSMLGPLRGASSCPTGACRSPARFSASRIWRAPCAPWPRRRRRRWPPAPAARQAIDAVRDYLLSRRYRAPHRRVHQAATAACCATKTWPRSTWSPEEPVSTTFHGYTVYKPGFWSQGPAMIEALNILEGFDLAEPCVSTPPSTSTRWWKP